MGLFDYIDFRFLYFFKTPNVKKNKKYYTF